MNTTSTPMARWSSTSLVWPIVLILIGILALALPVASSFGVARVLSWLLFFDGIILFFYAFKSEGVGRIVWKVLVAILYVGGGIYLLLNPLVGMAGLTLMLAVFFCAEGIMESSSDSCRFACTCSGRTHQCGRLKRLLPEYSQLQFRVFT